MEKLIKKNTVKWIFKKTKHRIPAILLLAATTIVSAYLGVRFALVTKQLVDAATSKNVNMLLDGCLLLVIFILIRTGCSVLGIHLQERLSAGMDRDIKQDILHLVLNGDYASISKYHSGDIIVRINSDASRVYSGILSLVASATGLITSLSTAVTYLTDLAPQFTLILVCLSIVMAFLTLLIQRKMKQLQLRAAAENGKVTGFMQEAISKLLMIQALDIAPEIEKKSDKLLEERWKVYRERKNLNIITSIASSILAYIGSFTAFLWCSFQLLNGRMTFGSLTATTQLSSQLQGPLLSLPKLIPQFISITTAAERLVELEEIDKQPSSNVAECQRLYDEMDSIEAENINFSYGHDNVLENISFSIPKGEMTVIMGVSGAGKSTILKLLLGIYKVSDGKLSIASKGKKTSISRETRRMFTYAPQGNLLLSGTLRENLLLINPTASQEELERALYIAAMDEYVSSLPNGLDTKIGENGAGLSEGQAQRLSLARAVLSDAPILLLDEVTSSLDAETEKVVLKRISELSDKTCIAVTHRSAILDIADNKLSLTQNGAELISLKGKI